MISGVVPNVQAALIGCLLMGLLGCVDFDSAYRSINRKSLILIVGMLPFSLALQRTGGVDLAADAVVGLVGGTAPRLVLAPCSSSPRCWACSSQIRRQPC
jgi:di/tricarboxylate transporter